MKIYNQLISTKIFFKIFLTLLFLKSGIIHSQAIQMKYLDKINYWKQDYFHKKVKEIETRHMYFYAQRSRTEAEQKIKREHFSKQVFNSFGKIISQLDKITAYNYSETHKNYRKVIYVYNTNQLLLKEKTYTNLDTVAFQPRDTAVYASKVYKYDVKGILLSCLEYNNAKVLIKTTTVTTDTIQKTIELFIKENNNYSSYLKTVHKFDDNANLIEQIFYKGNQPNGKNSISYNDDGLKEKEYYEAYDSHYESVNRYLYNKNGLLEVLHRNTNIDPGDKHNYTYTFDKNKNWLTKTIKNDDGVITESSTRKIVYYK
jgi:hypothetical protein